jgi:hypothetical protein
MGYRVAEDQHCVRLDAADMQATATCLRSSAWPRLPPAAADRGDDRRIERRPVLRRCGGRLFSRDVEAPRMLPTRSMLAFDIVADMAPEVREVSVTASSARA